MKDFTGTNPLLDMTETYTIALSMLRAYQQVLQAEKDLVPEDHHPQLVKLNNLLTGINNRAKILEKQFDALMKTQLYFQRRKKDGYLSTMVNNSEKKDFRVVVSNSLLDRIRNLFSHSISSVD